MTVLVDAGALIAFHDAQDQHHAAAVPCFGQLGRTPLVTSVPVLTEVATRGARLVGTEVNAAHLRSILSNSHYRIFEAGLQVFIEALDFMVKYAAYGFSHTDCTSIIIMRSLRIRKIFTFDRMFHRLGLEVIP